MVIALLSSWFGFEAAEVSGYNIFNFQRIEFRL
uniref:Uncharacterized protein n=1 Tax=Arundo donax TaxID=35708 RepID=A0A0A9HV16_ARUDO